MTTKVSHKHQKSNFEWSTYLLFDVVLLERLDELCGEVRPRVRLVEPSAESRSARIHMNSANGARGHAVQMDMFQAKAWAAWGKFNDKMFKENPGDMSNASNAVSCYLQAAGLYKNRTSRPLLTRVLWLLSVDDTTLAISQAFDKYKGDAAFWYWITLIPQLCLSVSQREAKQDRYILLNLAKLYPQVCCRIDICETLLTSF